MHRSIGLMTVCLLLGVGCASSPDTRYFVLDTLDAAESLLDDEVYVTRVRVPEYLDDTRLWVRSDTHRVQRVPHARWAENFPRALTRTLQDYLSPDVTESTADKRLLVDVRRFEAQWSEEGDQMVLLVLWRVADRDAETHRVRLTAELDDRDAETLVEVQSQLWQSLAEEIAATD